MRMTTRTRWAVWVALLIPIGPLAPNVCADALYQVTNLGNNQIVGLTAAGQVVESYYSGTPPYQTQNLLYSSYGPSAGQQTVLPYAVMSVSANGTVSGFTGSYNSIQPVIANVNTPNASPTPIQTNFPGLATIVGTNYTTMGVNDFGQTVGSAGTLPPGYVPGVDFSPNYHAFISNGSSITDLGALGQQMSTATAINNAGQVVGYVGSGDLNVVTHAFIYAAGKMVDIGGLPGYSFSTASAINSSGQVAGYSMNANGSSAAFLYSNGQMINLGTLSGDTSSSAMAINSKGAIVGSSDHLGPLTNSSNALNNNAWLYQNGILTNLNSLISPTLGIHLMDARAINDAGQIVSYGVDSYGDPRVYLLTPPDMLAPVDPVLFGNEVPEPSTLAFVMLLGAVGSARWGYRQLGKAER
jgi:probable HAF family extracellular repeat protein